MSEFKTIYIHTFQQRSGKVPDLARRKEMRKCCGPYQWTPRDPLKSDGIGFYQESRGMAMGDGPCRLRIELANDHLSGRRISGINGYYTTEDGAGDTIKPIIARLAHGRGYLAGWTMGCGMCASLCTSIYSDVESAAYAAHSEAESVAEREVETDLKYQEEQRQEELETEESEETEDEESESESKLA